MPSDLLMQIREIVSEFGDKVDPLVGQWAAEVRGGDALRAMELDLAARCRELADAITAAVLRSIVADLAFQATASMRARRQGTSYRHGGVRQVSVTLLGGGSVRLATEYLKPDHRRRRGRRRRTGRRGKAGAGLYPVLATLGIAFGVSPATAGEICRQVADSDSVRAGRAALDRRGLDLGHKPILRIVNQFSRRAVAQRNRWLQEAREKPAVSDGPLKGKRVVVAPDGGRIRERCPARHGRRRADTGHRRYDAPWREPKLFAIYVVNAKGEAIATFQPVYDGTLGDADALFSMMLGYLRALGAHQARELIFVGDGAEWIWNRTGWLASQLGIDPARVHEVVDWCHAVAVLHEIAAARAKWTQAQRDRWTRRAKRLLHAGDIDELLALIDALSVGRSAKKISVHRDYFHRNRARMQYRAFVAAHIPIGSGAVESAIRRVINMRLKSNGMFWLEVNAEGMLLLRSYLKAGRFDDLVGWSISTIAPGAHQHHASEPAAINPSTPSPIALRKAA